MDDKQIRKLAYDATSESLRRLVHEVGILPFKGKQLNHAYKLVTESIADTIRTALLEAGKQLLDEAYLDAQAAQKAAGANWVAIEKAIEELSRLKPDPPTGFVQVPLHVVRSCEKAIIGEE